MSTRVLMIYGVYGSPYSRKVLAAVRYMRVPHRWVVRRGPDDDGAAAPGPPLLPNVRWSDERQTDADSTVILQTVRPESPSRAIYPSSPALRFVALLLEDWADEFCTKFMFHYRWRSAENYEAIRRLLPLWTRQPYGDAGVLDAISCDIAERQRGRLRVVGSNDDTAGAIEAMFVRCLQLLEAHFAVHPFLLGAAPTVADFALFGQLSQLALVDPVPSRLAHSVAPRVVAWAATCDDLSGATADAAHGLVDLDRLPPTLAALFREIGATYVPVMLANHAALASGGTAPDSFEVQLGAVTWRQQPFKYQRKCVDVLRREFASLPSEADRDEVRRALPREFGPLLAIEAAQFDKSGPGDGRPRSRL